MVRPSEDPPVSEDALLDQITRHLTEVPVGPAAAGDPEAAHSLDARPPEGDLGAAIWIQAATAGVAVDAGIEVLMSVGQGLVGNPSWATLWDVRIVPIGAVSLSPPTTPLQKGDR